MLSSITKLFGLLLIFLLCASFNMEKKTHQKTMLVVVAHPDDEMTVAEVLVKFSRQGYKVVLVTATDGKYGTRVTQIPEGDSLAKIRREECICSSTKMGIDHPIFFGIDRLDTKNGVRNYFNCHKQLRDSLTHRIVSIDPDFIITFGPDGDTHHSEHIVVGGAVTEILLQHHWVDKYPLYYIAWTNNFSVPEGDLGFIDHKYVNVEISYSQDEELIGLEANRCFVSQQTPAEMDEDRQSKLLDTVNKTSFRRFIIKSGKKTTFD